MIDVKIYNLLNIHQIILYLIIVFLKFSISQLFERVTVQENMPLNTVIFDLKPMLERHMNSHLHSLSSPQSSVSPNRNITAFANQQETFWPFILDDFLIKLAKPLDREMICLLQTESLRHSVNRNDPSIASYSDTSQVCLPGACCKLLHVNIITSPTELPTPFYIQVAVQDINDNPPRFPPLHTPYIVIREDIKLDEKIWLPQAFDADSDQFNVAEYRAINWIHGNQSHFRLGISDSNDLNNDFISGVHEIPSSINLNSHLGKPYLTITEGLDRELIDLYSFTLIAVDGGGNIPVSNTPNMNKALTGSVSIIIKISDVNDNHPTFEQNTYRAEVAENSVNSAIIDFILIDRDVGDNGRVTIVIDDPTGQAQHLFRIILQPSQNSNLKLYSHSGFPNSPSQQSNNPAGTYYKGSLQIISPLDAERYLNMLRFHLVANDHGQPILSSRCEIQIRIINVNDNPPKIVFLNNGKRLSDGRISLPEVETPQRAIVALVHVTDDDSPIEQIRCHLIKEDDMFSFEETGSTNFLTHQQTQQSYNLFNEAIGIHSTYKQYVIRTRKIPDREEKHFYTVTVECIDDEGQYALSRNASLHITITDINEHKPIFTKSIFTGQVIENQLHAEVHMLTPIHATDLDVGVNALITYSLVNPYELSSMQTVTSISSLVTASTPSSSSSSSSLVNFVNGTAFFRIDPITGKLWTIQSLDCENRSEYHLVVIARDSGSPVPLSSSANIVITVEDTNDNVPEFLNTHYLFEVAENAPGGTEIGVVEAIDKDVTIINQRVRYNLRGNNEDLKLITIDRNSGTLRTRRPIDRESRSSISLIVEAENEVPIHRSPSARNDNFNTIMNHIGTEASVVITILNLNDNRPEFMLIEPHRSHVTFTWEQLNPLILPKQNQLNATTVHLKSDNQFGKKEKPVKEENQELSSLENANPVCEPLPHRVIDRDMESDSMLDCCILELLDNYNGLFALIPQAPSVLCAMYRPPTPQTYKLTLIAKDGLTNDSLSSQVHFTVIIRSDPNLRISERKNNNHRSDQLGIDYLTEKQSNFDQNKLHNDLTNNNFNYGERDRLNKDYLHRSLNLDGSANSGLLYPSGLSSSVSTSQQYKLNHSKSYGSGQQTIIIIVMASIAGVLCVLLLVAIVLTKRCTFDTVSTSMTNAKDFNKEEPNNQNESAVGMKCPSSTSSSPSKTKTFHSFPVNIHHIHSNPDYYAKEMIYHHPVGLASSETPYDISLETMKSPNTVTFLNNYTPFVPLNLRSNNTQLRAISMNSPQTRPIQCQIPIENDLYQEQKSPTIKSTTCHNPWSQSYSPTKNQTYMQVNLTNKEISPIKNSFQYTKSNENFSQSIYQTIDTQLLKHSQFSTTPTNSITNANIIGLTTPKMKRDHSNKLHDLNNNNNNSNNSNSNNNNSNNINGGKVHFNKTKLKLLPKEHFQQINDNLQFTKNDNNSNNNNLEINELMKPLLQRVNSERSPSYFQTSFV